MCLILLPSPCAESVTYSGGLFCCLLCPGTDQHGNCLQQFGARHHKGEGMCLSVWGGVGCIHTTVLYSVTVLGCVVLLEHIVVFVPC